MFEAFWQGLLSYGQPLALGFLVLGTCIGIFMGILPAIGGLAAMALLMPMVYGVDRVAGLSLLLSITAVSTTGGSVTAILMNIPGTATSTATMIDGFVMTKKGEAGRALGAMLASATMGSILGVVLALGMVPIVTPLVMQLASPEIFFLILMGISFLVILAGGSKIKGLIAGLLGVFAALIGFQHSTGVDRFAFGNNFLLEGLGLIPVLLGLFAGAELLDLAIGGQSIVPAELTKAGKELRRQMLRGMRDVFGHLGTWLRGCVLGYIVGVIPGIGCESAVWVAYAQAKQFSKNPEKFGTGCVEGVIAPEAASNATEGGALLTTVAIGLPGSAAMAILLGALMMQGVVPGKQMLTSELTLSFTLFWGLALSNLIGGVICYFIAGYANLTRLVNLAPRYLVPPILTLLFIAAFAMKQYTADIILALVFTLIGFLMKKLDFSRPAFLIGFILAGYLEDRLYLSLQTWGPLFFLRPGSLVIIFIMVALYSFQPIMSRVWRRQKVAAQ